MFMPNSAGRLDLIPAGLEKIPQPNNFKNMYPRQDGAD
jgi:hypothetical protein